MAPAASTQLHRLDTVAPSLMRPNTNLGSRTPMHLVHLSNVKLNAQIFSSRSLSIQRRILIKNFLTVLYQLHPIEWIEESPVDDKDQWLEQTLTAVGIGHSDASAQRDRDYDCNYDYNGYDYYDQGDYNYDYPASSSPSRLEHSGLLDLSPAAAAAASAVTSRRRPQSLRSNNVPLPRPVSMELPVALQSYLSTVFDVDWSVGLASKEDSLFTSKPQMHSPLRAALAPSTLASVATGPSVLPPVSSSPASQPSRRTLSAPSNSDYRGPKPACSAPSTHERNATNYSKIQLGESDHATDASYESSLPPLPQTRSYGSHVVHASLSTGIYSYHSQAEPEILSQPRSDQQQYSSTPQSDTRDGGHSYHESGPQPHVHNHIHIHIHSYPPNGLQSSSHTKGSASSERTLHPTPVIRSSRYPKQELLQRQQHQAPSSAENASHAHAFAPIGGLHESLSCLAEFPAPPKTNPRATPVAIAAAGPLTITPSPSLTYSSPYGVYPPEKTTSHLSAAGEEEEQPYLATAPPISSRYRRSPPPPPYTQSPEGASGPVCGAVSYPRVVKSAPIPMVHTSILTTKPQPPLPSSVSASSSASSSGSNNQQLIEYQQYQERQKMFLRDDDSKNEWHSSDGLGFIRQLFRHGSKKKAPMTVISAPLPAVSSLLMSSHTPYLLQGLVKQDVEKRMPSIRRSRAGRLLG